MGEEWGYDVTTSSKAWNFVRSVVGYGFETTQTNIDSQSSSPARSKTQLKSDILDYSRFENLAECDTVEELPQNEGPGLKIPDSLADWISAKPVDSNPSDEIDVEQVNDTHEYFDLKKNPVLQGCAHDR